MGCGCQRCASSKGETIVRELLSRLGLSYEEQVVFPDCKDKIPLPFDFVVNHCGRKFILEFQGAQHDRPVSFAGKKRAREDSAEERYRMIRKHDRLKRAWCRARQIPLLEIRSDQIGDEMEVEVKKFLGLT
jgi:hypothetical protein